MYARFLLFLGRPRPACGGRGSGFLACPAPDTAVPVRTRRRVEPAPAVMAMVVAGRWQIREARQHVCSVGAGRGTPAAVRVVGESGWGGGVPVCRKPGARVCRIKRVSVCPAVGRAVGCRYGCRPARKRRSGRMPGRLRPDARPAGIAWVSQPNRAVGLPERGACCGYGRSAVLAARKK